MSDEAELVRHQDTTQRMMRRLDGLARGLGLYEAATREIVMRIAADMPGRPDKNRLETARRALLAAASS